MHSWDLTPRQAVALQKKLRSQVRTDLKLGDVKTVLGVDVAYLKATGESVAAALLLSYPELAPIEQSVVRVPTPFPYVPGLLSFREAPAMLEACGRLRERPDLVFVDGHGQAHPRRFGIASHLGLWLKLPTVGIGKSRLCGEHREPAAKRGSNTRLLADGETIGRVLRTRDGVKPIYVSIGYGLRLEECVRWTLAVTPRYRIPEPIRRADRLCADAKRDPRMFA